MRIDDNLNLVLPIGEFGYLYHVPISREVFELNYRLLAYTRAELASQGVYYQMGAGPRVAALTLRDKAMKDDKEQGLDPGSEASTVFRAQSFFRELKRLSTVVAPSADGYAPRPVDAAISGNALDEETWGELESQLTFFTCHWCMAPKADRRKVMEATASVFGASMVSSPLTAYVASLKTSTPTESSPTVAS